MEENNKDNNYLGYEPVIEGLVESKLNSAPAERSPWADRDIIPAEEIAGLLYGQKIVVECLPTHPKKKHLGWAARRYDEAGKRLTNDVIPTEQQSKVCKVAGLGKSAFGMSLIINPQGSGKNPFPMHLLEYGRTWVAFYMETDGQE